MLPRSEPVVVAAAELKASRWHRAVLNGLTPPKRTAPRHHLAEGILALGEGPGGGGGADLGRAVPGHVALASDLENVTLRAAQEVSQVIGVREARQVSDFVREGVVVVPFG